MCIDTSILHFNYLKPPSDAKVSLHEESTKIAPAPANCKGTRDEAKTDFKSTGGVIVENPYC